MINFLRYRPLCAVFSALIFVTFIAAYVYRVSSRGHAFNYSVEFTGGTQVLFKFSEPVSDVVVKEILEKNGWENPTLRKFSETELLVRVKSFSSDLKGMSEQMRERIQTELSNGVQVEIVATDSVGSGVGEGLRTKSFQAVLIALILMLIYIWFRFWSLSYGLGALVSLFHDAVVILLVFLLLDKEISMNVIGAILTILGYSINDTIVIFNRIREEVKAPRGRTMETIVNFSLNQTLRRTTLTSFATTLVVISLILLGGETLRDLALALFVGIVFGTYSSIYIASPVMLLLHKEQKA